MIVEFDTVVAFVGSEDIRVEHEAVERSLKRACRREFESVEYFLERYDGTGKPRLYLKQYPVSVFSFLSCGVDNAIKLRNTNTGISASVSVGAAGLSFERDGVALTPITFAANTTITSIVTAINAMGSGWEAALMYSWMGTYPSRFLLKRWGASCINSNWVYLQTPQEAEDDYEVYEGRGIVTLTMGAFPYGKNNVFATYTAGYTATEMPEDLKWAVCSMVKFMYQHKDEELWNVSRYRVGEIDISFADKAVPTEVQDVIAKYKRYMI